MKRVGEVGKEEEHCLKNVPCKFYTWSDLVASDCATLTPTLEAAWESDYRDWVNQAQFILLGCEGSAFPSTQSSDTVWHQNYTGEKRGR